MNVHSSVLEPAREGEPFLVVASAFPILTTAQKSWGTHLRDFAATAIEARQRCCELARAVQRALEIGGQSVTAMHCSHCPHPDNPGCGPLRVPAAKRE